MFWLLVLACCGSVIFDELVTNDYGVASFLYGICAGGVGVIFLSASGWYPDWTHDVISQTAKNSILSGMSISAMLFVIAARLIAAGVKQFYREIK